MKRQFGFLSIVFLEIRVSSSSMDIMIFSDIGYGFILDILILQTDLICCKLSFSRKSVFILSQSHNLLWYRA
jgi:hypothetical protein